MSIPRFDGGGTLPAFVGSDPTGRGTRSPYRASIDDLIDRFATSRDRAKLLIGLNQYRKRLFDGGFIAGRQWIDGSFVEDVESTRNRPPKDIDVVTLFNRPLKYFSDPKLWAHDYRAFLHNDFFNTLTIKPKYHCDTYCIDMDGDPFSSVSSATYWFGLFSEQRGSSRRKGIVEVPLATDPMEFQRVDSQLAVKFNV
ncbi:MAG: hypothetical protein KDK28_00975 [Maritimibacter sp.]|nr:hypothetical protein [Maritimibacter sp.]